MQLYGQFVLCPAAVECHEFVETFVFFNCKYCYLLLVWEYLLITVYIFLFIMGPLKTDESQFLSKIRQLCNTS
jgi:hypothetical protein